MTCNKFTQAYKTQIYLEWLTNIRNLAETSSMERFKTKQPSLLDKRHKRMYMWMFALRNEILCLFMVLSGKSVVTVQQQDTKTT